MDANNSAGTQRSPVIEINLFGMFRRRWPLVIFGLFVGLSLAALYYASATRMYQSSIEILVGQRSSEVTNNGTISGSDASGDAIQEDQLATHLRLFVGRKRLSEAIKNFQLDQLASFRKAAENGTGAIDHILDHIEILRGGEGSARSAMVLRATYRDEKPEDAALVLTAVYETYRDYVESHGQNSTKQAVELIQEARKTHEKELKIADQNYRDFIQSVPVLFEGDNVKDVHKERLNNIEIELNDVNSSLAQSQSRLEVITTYLRARKGDNLDSIDHLALLSHKEVERLKLFLDITQGETQSEAFQAEQPMRQEVAKAQYNRLLDLIQKERSLSDAFGPGHPLVEAVRKETEITRRFIDSNAPAVTEKATKKLDPASMVNTYISLLANDIAEFTKRKEILLASAAEEMKLAKQVESDFMMGNALKSNLDRAQDRYEEVIRRLQELNLSRSYAGFSTDLLASPEVSKSAAWPKLPIVAAIGMVLGLGLGIVLAVCAELMDSTFSSVGDLEEALGAPAIAHVPQFDARKLREQVKPDSLLQPSLIAFHSPRSAESEVYRVARTSLMMTNRRNHVRTMVMTSPQPGDGKSTTISNLAITFARTGKKVLLVDADMRRPVIASSFAIDGEPGLSDILTGRRTAAEVTQSTQVPGLSIISHGSPTSVPSELLESTRFSNLLSEMRREYDLVLIDAPPILAVADPVIIAPQVDSVVLTVRVTKNGRRTVEQAAKVLKDLSIELTGVVVNGVDQNGKGFGYGNYRRDSYGYVGHYHERYAALDVDDEVRPTFDPPPVPAHLRGKAPVVTFASKVGIQPGETV
jgi:capsular exopolysaccharide synthesis family protein